MLLFRPPVSYLLTFNTFQENSGEASVLNLSIILKVETNLFVLNLKNV